MNVLFLIISHLFHFSLLRDSFRLNNNFFLKLIDKRWINEWWDFLPLFATLRCFAVMDVAYNVQRVVSRLNYWHAPLMKSRRYDKCQKHFHPVLLGWYSLDPINQWPQSFVIPTLQAMFVTNCLFLAAQGAYGKSCSPVITIIGEQRRVNTASCAVVFHD